MNPISKLLYDGYQYQLRGKLEEAARLYRKILRAEPRNADVLILLGIVRDKQLQHTEALELFNQAIRLKPESPQAHYNRGVSLAKFDRFEEAAAAFFRAHELRPELPQALSEHARSRRSICDWETYDWLDRELTAYVREGRTVVNPFTFMQFSDDPADHFACTRMYTTHHLFPKAVPQRTHHRKRSAGERIRLGYLSADFKQHPVANLVVGLIETHDRERFEVTAFSLGQNDESAMQARMMKAFDHFIDAWDMPTEELVARIYDLNIDILVDLTGHTDYSRVEALAARPAPIQVNYLGYPGTIGADFIDYIVVDPFVVPSDRQSFFNEKLVHLPDTYQPNDPKRAIHEHTPTRAECGLPEQGFVFCCFNNNFKIAPRIFDVWMRLLLKVPGSMFWILKDKQAIEPNLIREAAARGVDPARIVFAPRIPLAEHLARHRLADLFLDTLPYNAHTTASDALWTGLPLVTCAGKTFPARVAGSLLRTVGLPDLVTTSLADYEALAFALATDPARLQEVRERLRRNRLTTPLFDLERYRRHIEAAYETMVETWRRGEEPRAFTLEPLP